MGEEIEKQISCEFAREKLDGIPAAKTDTKVCY